MGSRGVIGEIETLIHQRIDVGALFAASYMIARPIGILDGVPF